ncbi:MAG: zinc-binding dehydrogenase [Actinomycetia bacterium]|nr:zinc-binding dehydrogenase [Actinomycetes bacterium]
MKALRFERREVRYAAAAISSRVRPGSGAATGPLKLVDEPAPMLPNDEWVRVWPRLAGICGSDLSTVDGQSSRYFEPFVSFPFVLGHEIVGETADHRRVVVEPVLGHACRGLEPPFPGAAPGDGDDFRHLVSGDLEPGLQIGFCESTGGGWATELIVHQSLLHEVPERLSDEHAVMIEPVACATHGVLRGKVSEGDTVAVIGAGTMGLGAVAALGRFTKAGTVLLGARYPVQHKFGRQLGASEVVGSGELGRAIRRHTGSFEIGGRLSGGADVVIDAVGSQSSLEEAIGLARPRGRVVVLGMPGRVDLDLTALWHRETELVGAYCYGTEDLDGRKVHTFELATELVEAAGLDRLVSAHYPLARYEDAVAHAAEAGPRGAVKVVFDVRNEKRRGLPRGS